MEPEGDAGAGVARRPIVPGQRPDQVTEVSTRTTRPTLPTTRLPQSPQGGAPTPLVARYDESVLTDVREIEHAIARARNALGFTGRPTLVERSIDARVEVDHDGVIRALTRRTAWEALRDGADTFAVTALVPPPGRGRVEVEGLRGCVAGPEYVDLRSGVCVRALSLREPLALGQWAESTHRVRWPVATAGLVGAQTEWELETAWGVDEIRLEVAFCPTRLPRRAELSVRGAEGRWTTQVPVLEDALTWSGGVDGPSLVTLRWEW